MNPFKLIAAYFAIRRLFPKGTTMNTPLVRTIMDVLMAVSGILTVDLLYTGCTQAATGGFDCSHSMLNSWFNPVYVAGFAMGVAILKITMKAFAGELVGPATPPPVAKKNFD